MYRAACPATCWIALDLHRHHRGRRGIGHDGQDIQARAVVGDLPIHHQQRRAFEVAGHAVPLPRALGAAVVTVDGREDRRQGVAIGAEPVGRHDQADVLVSNLGGQMRHLVHILAAQLQRGRPQARLPTDLRDGIVRAIGVQVVVAQPDVQPVCDERVEQRAPGVAGEPRGERVRESPLKRRRCCHHGPSSHG